MGFPKTREDSNFLVCNVCGPLVAQGGSREVAAGNLVGRLRFFRVTEASLWSAINFPNRLERTRTAQTANCVVLIISPNRVM